MNLALFDFDGTVSTRDSYLLFTKFISRQQYLMGCFILAPKIICYLAGLYPNTLLKEDFLCRFYRGKSLNDLQMQAQKFCSLQIPSILRPKAIERILWHQNRGDVTVIVSAAPRLILEPWCQSIRTDIIATELATDQDLRVTGKIAGINCWGNEKVRRIQQRYILSEYDEIFSYGDSAGDLPMLDIASPGNRFFKPFR